MAPLNQGLLWRFSAGDESPSYLLGTIHIDSAYFRKHQLQFQALLHECHSFAAEVDLDEMVGMPFHAMLIGNEQDSWKYLLSERKLAKLNRWSKHRFKVDLLDFDRMHPILVLHMLTLQLVHEDHQKSIDQSLWEMAGTSGLARFGLESLEEHFNVLNAFSVADQLKLLVEFLKNTQNARIKFDHMVLHYENGQLDLLFKESKRMLGRNRHVMLNVRNENMAKKIVERNGRGGVFYTCGAAHLAGNKGILSFLKRSGYKLKPLDL